MNRTNVGLLLLLASASTAAAAPLTGGAQSLVMRLARAGGVSLSSVRMTDPAATASAARLFNAQKYCLSDRALAALQRQPSNAGVQAMVFLEFRCVTRVQGQALTPDLALSALRSTGYAVRGADLLVSLLNNPSAANSLIEASQTAVTPLTPRN
ncbi:hypothetical protein LAJ19_14210 (plasmid) [Deinococcus taeanensis]|uniref:hypothetical protein n=1 Tax=Deinococcus taeanensis TaxID=2737050 RepID=UPI001CDB5E9A|nr:hypothetical protein [Deinococcus taeanensis]UBV44319.1 hypothetical protein LAJ19_14210 [Deinococcus taeanensis]